jgi:hypothetical protein
MSGTHINRPRPEKFIDIILEEDFNKSVPKPTNLRPGYDIEYVRNRYHFPYPGQFEKMVEVEKIYDNLSIINLNETPYQWAIRVKGTLQTLINEGYRSYYHVFCLFGSFGQGVTKTCYDNYEGREVAIGYHRPNIHNNKMAICFDCWKLVKIPDVKPEKTYFDGWRRYGYEIKPEDLMKYHWDNECFKINKHIEAFLKGPAPSHINSKPENIPGENKRNFFEIESSSPPADQQIKRGSKSELFISSIYAKQNNLFPHLNQYKGSTLRLRDGTVIMFV